MKTEYLDRNTKIGAYVPVPVSLLGSGLGSTTLLIYASLLNRAMLSVKNGWTDSEGYFYIQYTVEDLAVSVGKGLSTVKEALSRLEGSGLIERKRISMQRTHIYVKVPKNRLVLQNSGLKKSVFDTESSRKTDWSAGGKPATSNYIEKHYNTVDKYSYEEGESL